MLERMFNYENPVWQFMGRVADMMILNALALICSIPIITIGASWTAMYYCTLKLVRKEESYIWKDFFKSFKENFKQATLIWLILIPFILVLGIDMFMWFGDPTLLPKPLKVTTIIVVLIVLSITTYVFPVLSRFENTISNTLKNAFLLALVNLPLTIYFLLLNIGPIVLVLIDLRVMMFYALFGFSVPAMLATYGWNRIFKKVEPKSEEDEEEEDGDEWTLEPLEGEESEGAESSEKIEEKTEEETE